MRVVFWNCNGGFRNKYQYITKFDADLYIIAEVEGIDKLNNEQFKRDVQSEQYLAFPGDKKGLLVFTCRNEPIEPLHWDNYRMRYFMPFKFMNKTFLGIWSKDNYIEDIYLYTGFHLEKLADTILIGDLNSNVIWDSHHGYRTHSDFNELMASIKHISAYHDQSGEKFGKETQPTFFMYRKINRPYHIDYAYVPKGTQFEISFGSSHFLEYSDHLPMVLDL
ncbi:hypothetical protein FAM21834_01543 [Lentilactobacillus parabuchneri]|jgi:hypothetical protein|uniref:Endonuclease/Exonuclease/phosphatase family protein n=2 Tax=Lentilactobacillus parabuchneri TaxID=152331 RepID=A0A1X1FED9_9LACO|nr:endonuclease/exonuclease/phosphatase family protein [Lentilactobacillus parabuchneri]APR07661.1 hypothetical protein FAM21731_01484 [Lentilactobacillus parabuchneri]KRM45134.1 hypothetical protein FC51_GL001234 [Lentilactobacillus parabuchneri DSM 5707 = NBRC 107865]KRN72798.1 hypothetical protein IV42_GL001273 [Lentilactobacillus parabuchneri]MBW0222867.1 endonuclease/exonuclease/phosphatase family protein [Lentilactobacillus parabuchneri]MBW0263998.1 endonuclease/exonuclease/phosphatase f